MSATKLQRTAAANLQQLSTNPYPGRGVAQGLSDDGRIVQIVWLMGRSANSRNRVYRSINAHVYADAIDHTDVINPELVMYTAMESVDGYHVVGNGRQTDAIADGWRSKRREAYTSLATWSFEPDEPHFTPRISATARLVGDAAWSPAVQMDHVIISRGDGGKAERNLLSSYGSHGLAFCMTTYQGDGNPLPRFTGLPYLVPLHGDDHDIAYRFWNALNTDNRVALALKSVSVDDPSDFRIKIINKHR